MLEEFSDLLIEELADLPPRPANTPHGVPYTRKVKRPNKTNRTMALPLSFAQFANPSPTYFEQDGLRKVVPYTNAFSSYIKERWINRTLIDV